MKVVELATSAGLSEKALAEAMKRVSAEIHDGWADLIVHQSMIRPALRLAAAHNEKKPGLQIRVLLENRMGHDDWKLKTISVEVRVIWEKA